MTLMATKRDPRASGTPVVRQLSSAGRTPITREAILALIPTSQRLEVAAMLLNDEVRRQMDPSIAPPVRPDDSRVLAMSQILRATSALRQRFAEVPNAGNIDGISLRYELTGRQREVLTLLLFGLSEKVIAFRVGLSRHTVHEHVKAIYRVMLVNSRAELMARCLREEFIEMSEQAMEAESGCSVP